MLSPPPDPKWCDFVPGCERDIQPGQESDFLSEIGRIQDRLITEHNKENVFFFITSGHMGIGPPWMKEGDVVSLLLGSRVPFVLRRYEIHPDYEGAEEHFHLIGEYCKSLDQRIST